jgi:hypothetical protein
MVREALTLQMEVDEVVVAPPRHTVHPAAGVTLPVELDALPFAPTPCMRVEEALPGLGRRVRLHGTANGRTIVLELVKKVAATQQGKVWMVAMCGPAPAYEVTRGALLGWRPRVRARVVAVGLGGEGMSGGGARASHPSPVPHPPSPHPVSCQSTVGPDLDASPLGAASRLFAVKELAWVRVSVLCQRAAWLSWAGGVV